MGRAATKADLIKSAEKGFDDLWKLIDSMTAAERTASFDFGDGFSRKEAHWKRDKNLRDVLVHLYEWHRLLLDWVRANQKGEAKPFLPAPYNWKTYGQMNVSFWEKHQSTSYEAAEKMVQASHEEVMGMIDSLTEEALFERGHAEWTGGSTLGAYCVSATSSHYDWAVKKLKVHLKTYRKAQAEKQTEV